MFEDLRALPSPKLLKLTKSETEPYILQLLQPFSGLALCSYRTDAWAPRTQRSEPPCGSCARGRKPGRLKVPASSAGCRAAVIVEGFSVRGLGVLGFRVSGSGLAPWA